MPPAMKLVLGMPAGEAETAEDTAAVGKLSLKFRDLVVSSGLAYTNALAPGYTYCLPLLISNALIVLISCTLLLRLRS